MIEAILSKRRPHNRILLSVLIVVLYPALLLAENIPLIKKGGVYEIPVEINGVITLNFVLDTGASEVNLPADVVLTLYHAGTIKDADFLPGKTYRLADGSQVNSSRFVLRSLKIGQRRITDVAASIGSVSSSLLLGQSFLEKLGAWGIDSQKQVLTIGTTGPKEASVKRSYIPKVSDNPPKVQVIDGNIVGSWEGIGTFQNDISLKLIYTFYNNGVSFAEVSILPSLKTYEGWGQYIYANRQLTIQWNSGNQLKATLVWIDSNTFRSRIVGSNPQIQLEGEITFRRR